MFPTKDEMRRAGFDGVVLSGGGGAFRELRLSSDVDEAVARTAAKSPIADLIRSTILGAVIPPLRSSQLTGAALEKEAARQVDQALAAVAKIDAAEIVAEIAEALASTDPPKQRAAEGIDLNSPPMRMSRDAASDDGRFRAETVANVRRLAGMRD